VSAVPGIGYGDSCDAFIRVSIGTESMDDIRLGLRKIKSLIDATS
jgi:aminotransferase